MTTAEAKLERILGPNWPALSVKQVRDRAFELEAKANELGKVSSFAWAVICLPGGRTADRNLARGV